jgi:hypothetical protein
MTRMRDRSGPFIGEESFNLVDYFAGLRKQERNATCEHQLSAVGQSLPTGSLPR